jgi:hypothetical protein
MTDIIFKFDTFLDWYRNPSLYSYPINKQIFWYQKNSKKSYYRKLDYLNKLITNLSIANNIEIYVNINSTRILFIMPKEDIINGRNGFWGHHFHFVKDDYDDENNQIIYNDIIKFHKTIEKDIGPRDHKTFKNCYFPDNQIIKYTNNAYDIDNLKCIDNTNKILIQEFPDNAERRIIKHIILMPFLFPIPNTSTLTTSIQAIAGGNKNKICKESHICKLLDKIDEMSVIIMKYKQIWCYTITLYKKRKDFNISLFIKRYFRKNTSSKNIKLS